MASENSPKGVDEMKRIIKYLETQENFKNLEKLISTSRNLQIYDLYLELYPLLIAYIYQKTKKSIVVVATNIFNAQKIFDELNYILENVCFYPKDEFVSTELLAESKEFKIERINTLESIFSGEPQIIVTNLMGVLSYTMPKEKIQNNILHFEKNKEYDIQNIIQKLVMLGYKRTYTVESQGEFSVRGGILDIYSLTSKQPYRLDFFGDELEEIKEFDIDTQKSTGKADKIDVYPVYEFIYTEEEKEKLLSYIEDKKKSFNFTKDDLAKIEKDHSSIVNYENLDRLFKYIKVINDSSSSIIDYIDDKIVIYADYYNINDSTLLINKEISEYYESCGNYSKMNFSYLNELSNIFVKNQNIFLNKRKDDIDFKCDELYLPNRDIFNYDDNLELFKKDLKASDGKKTTVLSIRTATVKNSFISMLEDENIKYKIISEDDDIIPNIINILSKGYLPNANLIKENLIIINERAIFKKVDVRPARYKGVFKEAKRIKTINELQKGDYIVHYDYGIGQFVEIVTLAVGKEKNDYIYIKYAGDGALYLPVDKINLIAKYAGSEAFVPKLNKMDKAEWAKTKQKVREKAANIAEKLIELYAKREASKGFAFLKDNELQKEFEDDFIYEATSDQIRAVEDVKKDMEKESPMDRLICGDVGFGKTEVALRAAFKAVLSGKQVAYLAPTTVLSRQHYYTFKERMEKFGVVVKLLNRFVTPKEVNNTIKQVKEGKADILIGTHRILSNDIKFKDLGLLIIDEEQRFGVTHKEKIKEIKINVDVLTLTATPIPRTLQMAIMGVKNMSLLDTPPKDRYPVQTYVLERNDYAVKEAIERELSREGQVFYLYNKVQDIDQIVDKLNRLVPYAKIAFAHGQMSRIDLENIISEFIDGKFDVLVSTTIIETGIDIPNANTLIIHNAENLGLSQLYQIRGRVGRSNKIAYAYFMYDNNKKLTDEAYKRLKVIKDFTELGSGFKIALRDLSIRGAGDVLGSEQSGFIDSVGLDLYMKILEEEIKKKKGEDVLEEETKPILKINKFIDKDYIENDYVKLEMHKKINNLKSLPEAEALKLEFIDRFGQVSPELNEYIDSKIFEYYLNKVGIEKVLVTKTNVIMIFSELASLKLAGEKIFKVALDINRNIRFMYKEKKIQVIIDTINLEEPYQIVAIKFFEKIA